MAIWLLLMAIKGWLFLALWCIGVLDDDSDSAPASSKKLDGAGNDIKEFVQLRYQLFKVTAGCDSLPGLATTVDKIVKELPRLLSRQREILEGLSVVRKVENSLNSADRDQRSELIQQLEAVPVEIELLLRDLRVRLKWTIEDVVMFRAGLPKLSAEIRRDQRELNAYLEAMQNSVREVRLLGELEDGVFRKYAEPQSIEDESLDSESNGTVSTEVKVH